MKMFYKYKNLVIQFGERLKKYQSTNKIQLIVIIITVA